MFTSCAGELVTGCWACFFGLLPPPTGSAAAAAFFTHHHHHYHHHQVNFTIIFSFRIVLSISSALWATKTCHCALKYFLYFFLPINTGKNIQELVRRSTISQQQKGHFLNFIVSCSQMKGLNKKRTIVSIGNIAETNLFYNTNRQ